METIPQCFNHCVKDFESGMTPNEKNCMRECYFKKITSKDDMAIYFHLQLVAERSDALRDIVV